MAKNPTRAEIQARMRDEEAGIHPGADFGKGLGSLGGGHHHEVVPIPDIKDLGLPSKVRQRIEFLTGEHADLGLVERQAAEAKANITAEIKVLVQEHVPEDMRTFQCRAARVNYSCQRRSSFSKDACRVSLLNQGVQPGIVSKAIEDATTVNEVVTLRVTPVGEA
jgi:hypothetical protein